MVHDDPGWWGVNPAERLRAITRRGVDDDELPVEAAGALAGFAAEPAHLVVACRRLLAHRRACAPLWWTCARVLAAAEPVAACREVVRRFEADRTAARLAATLPVLDADQVVAVLGWPREVDAALCERADVAAVAVRLPGAETTRLVRRRSAPQPVRVVDVAELDHHDVVRVLVPASAVGAGRALVATGTVAAVEHLTGTHRRAETWLVAATGRVLPERLFAALVSATDQDPEDPDAVELLSLERVDRVVGPRGLERPLDAVARPECPVAPELLRPL